MEKGPYRSSDKYFARRSPGSAQHFNPPRSSPSRVRFPLIADVAAGVRASPNGRMLPDDEVPQRSPLRWGAGSRTTGRIVRVLAGSWRLADEVGEYGELRPRYQVLPLVRYGSGYA